MARGDRHLITAVASGATSHRASSMNTGLPPSLVVATEEQRELGEVAIAVPIPAAIV